MLTYTTQNRIITTRMSGLGIFEVTTSNIEEYKSTTEQTIKQLEDNITEAGEKIIAETIV